MKVLLLLLHCSAALAQTADSVRRQPDLVNTLSLDFYTTLNGMQYLNALEGEQRAQTYVYCNGTANNRLQSRTFTLRTYLFDEYGLRHYFDSVSVKSADRFTLRNNLQIQCWKRFSICAGLELKTQLWKTWLYREDTSGIQSRYLHSDYNSPGYTLYAFGASIRLAGDAVLDVGLVSGKITRMRNQTVFRERRTRKLYGLEEGEERKAEWGLSLQLSIPPRKLGSHFGWEFSGSLFAPRKGTGRLRSYTADANNVLHYLFFRHMRLSLRTQLQFDEAVQEKIFVMTHISLGFYLNNRI